MQTTLTVLTTLLVLGACGGATPQVEPPRSDRDDVSDPTPTVAALPHDLTIVASGGPVAAWMGAGEVFHTVRLEPRPGTPGDFDLVDRAERADESGMRSTLEQEQRAHVPRARAEALWRLIEQHRDELAGPCMDPTIMDGATSGFQVTANGVDASFTCTNASTPAFDALSEAWRSLVQDVLPAPNP